MPKSLRFFEAWRSGKLQNIFLKVLPLPRRWKRLYGFSFSLDCKGTGFDGWFFFNSFSEFWTFCLLFFSLALLLMLTLTLTFMFICCFFPSFLPCSQRFSMQGVQSVCLRCLFLCCTYLLRLSLLTRFKYYLCISSFHINQNSVDPVDSFKEPVIMGVFYMWLT